MDREYLTLEHIEKSFGGNRALKDVSFSVKRELYMCWQERMELERAPF